MWCLNERGFLLSFLVLSHVVSGHGEWLCFALHQITSLCTDPPFPPLSYPSFQPCVCTHASQIMCTGMNASGPYTTTHSISCVPSSKLSNLAIHLLVDSTIRRFGHAFLAGDLVDACRACVSMFECMWKWMVQGERGEGNVRRKREGET